MKSLAKPRYTQEQYDQASAVYMRWCYVQALREGRPAPSRPARLPLLRPTYGRAVAGVAKAVSMHLGVSVHLVRFIFIITSFFFGSGLIAYIFLWITIPTGDPVHLHFHLAPKYVDGPDYGGTFQMNPGKVYLTEAEYQELIDAIKANL